MNHETLTSWDADDTATLIMISGLSGKEFGRLLNVTEMTVNRWEQGLSKPGAASIGIMMRLRRRLVTMDEAAARAHYEELALCPDPVEIYQKWDLGAAWAGEAAQA